MMDAANKFQASIGLRLKTEMAKLGLSAAELAKRSDVKPSFIYDIIHGKSSNPSTIKLARVAESLGVSLPYLIGKSEHAGQNDRSTHRFDEAPAGDYVAVSSMLVDASAGAGSVVTVEREGKPYFFRRAWIRDRLGVTPADLRMIFIRGDSMEPTLCHNDMVLVDISKKFPSPPGIFILFDGFGLVAKRLEFVTNSNPPSLRIISDNLQYSTYERALEETHIIGRVVWFAREM